MAADLGRSTDPMSFIERLKSLFKPTEDKVRVSLDGVDIVLTSPSGEAAVIRRAEVLEIFAYKEDLYVVDNICIGFRIDADGEYFRIDEEMEGYATVFDALPSLYPGMRDDWWSAVAFPAFERCLTHVWGDDKMTLITGAVEQGDSDGTAKTVR